MNVFEVKATTQAEEQIREIAYHISVTLQAPDAAAAMLDDLDEAFETISKNPERQFLVEEEENHPPSGCFSKSYFSFSSSALVISKLAYLSK